MSIILVLLFLRAITEIYCCDCGCNRPSDFGQAYHLSDLGVKVCDDDLIPPLEIQKPICPPPPSICKELGIQQQAPFYPPPPKCGCGGSWLPYLPKCLRRRIRHPFCITGANLLNQKLALSKLRLYGPAGGCGCGCGFN